MKKNLLRNIFAIIAVALTMTLSAENDADTNIMAVDTNVVAVDTNNVAVDTNNIVIDTNVVAVDTAKVEVEGTSVVPPEPSKKKMPLWLMITIIAVGVCAITAAVFVVLRKNKKKKDMNTLIENPGENNRVNIGLEGVPNGNKLRETPTSEVKVTEPVDNEEVIRLKAELDKAQKALTAKDHELQTKQQDWQSQMQNWQSQINKAQAEIAGFTAKLAEKNGEITKLNNELMSVKGVIANRDVEIEKLHNDFVVEQRNANMRIQSAMDKAVAAIDTWRADRDAIMGKIIDLGDKLVEQLSKMSPEAFNGNCGTIINGAKNFVAMLKEKMSGEQWHDKKTGECLAELRTIGVSLIEAGTNSWVNLLGRLYSYMSVPELEMRLNEEGVDFEKVTEIYLTVGAIFSSFGMVLYNCSPGFDSANDKATAYMFQHKSSIDRITRWLDGEEAVKSAVQNHGHTVYDFGQLAYITVDDTNIHQGCVMFYNE